MKTTTDQAQNALNDIEDAARRIRLAMANNGSDIAFMVWGVVWALGFIGSYAAEWLVAGNPDVRDAAGVGWLLFGGHWSVLVFVGIGATYLIFKRAGNRVRVPDTSRLGLRIGLFWFFLYLYLWVGYAIIAPHVDLEAFGTIAGAKRAGAVGALVPMFAYVVMGLWLERYFIWIGLIVTGLVLLGVFVAMSYFWLWMAVLGGGALFASGLVVRYRWGSLSSLQSLS